MTSRRSTTGSDLRVRPERESPACRGSAGSLVPHAEELGNLQRTAVSIGAPDAVDAGDQMADLSSARGGTSVRLPPRQVEECEFAGAPRPTQRSDCRRIESGRKQREARYGYQAPEASLDKTSFGGHSDRRCDDRPVVHHPGWRSLYEHDYQPSRVPAHQAILGQIPSGRPSTTRPTRWIGTS